MKIGKDISARFYNLNVIHQNLPGKKVSGVSHPQHILFLPLQGEIQLEVENLKHRASPGQMLYLPPGISHSFFSSSGGGERLIALLEKRFLRTNVQGCAVLPLNQLTKEILFYLLLHPHTKNARSLVKVFSETLAETLRQMPRLEPLEHLGGRVADPRVRQALKLMRANMEKRDSVAEIAARAGLSARNLQRLIQKETGLSPRDWSVRFRMERAKELLKKPGASVTSVALEVGYQSLSQFISSFRTHAGQLPSEFLRHG